MSIFDRSQRGVMQSPLNPPVISVGGGSSAWHLVYVDLSPSDILAKQITLVAPPASGAQVMIDIVNGTAQRYGLDFTVTGSVVDWNGLGMESILDSTTSIRIGYAS